MAVSWSDIISRAKTLLGSQYVYGEAGPTTFDCSGLTQFVYKGAGISIPRTSEEQFKGGRAVSEADAVPGTLVFFGGNGYDGSPDAPGHVGIYIGGGQMIDAPHTGSVVRVDSIAGNVGFRDYGIQGASDASVYSQALGAGIGQALTGNPDTGSLFSFPAEIVAFFADVDREFTRFYKHAALFFQPSTYVRIGAGLAGTLFVITGLVFLMREARTP